MRPAYIRCGALARARLAALCFGAAVSGGGKGSLCDLSAALWLAPGSPRRRRSRSARLAVLCFGGALAPLGSPPSVSARRFQAAEKALFATFRAALSLTLGSPPSVSARRFPAAAKALCATFCGGALAPLGSPPSVSAALPLTPGSPLRCFFAPPSSQSC